MSSFQTSPRPEPISYRADGFASIEVVVTSDGVTLVANADGCRSLAQMFDGLAEGQQDAHVHLTPTLQLAPDSFALVVARREGGMLPSGEGAPTPQASAEVLESNDSSSAEDR